VPDMTARPDQEKRDEGMPAAPTQAQRFGKARADRSTALSEDYVELIDDLQMLEGEARAVDLARRFGVAHATVLKTLARLKREELVTAKPYRGVFLTAEGKTMADMARTRHRLVVDLLKAVGVPAEAAEADAEGIEHHTSDVTLTAIARFLRTKA
jgi:DtxR family manganese transport transcriptional regulator